MSHRITVTGNFGNASCLKAVLDEKKVRYSEEKDGKGDTIMTFTDGRYNRYGNSLRINLTNPKESTMDSDLGYEVRGWYRDAMARHVEEELLIQGHTVTSRVEHGQNIVLRVAVG